MLLHIVVHAWHTKRSVTDQGRSGHPRWCNLLILSPKSPAAELFELFDSKHPIAIPVEFPQALPHHYVPSFLHWHVQAKALVKLWEKFVQLFQRKHTIAISIGPSKVLLCKLGQNLSIVQDEEDTVDILG